jgi:hypothetical protein
MENPTKMDENWGYPHSRKPPNVFEGSQSSVKILPLSLSLWQSKVAMDIPPL